MPHAAPADLLSLPRLRAAQVLGVTARAWGLASAPAAQRRPAPPVRAAARAAACIGWAGASPSRLRLSAHGFDISY